MWVCLCKGVTDRQVRSAITRGARTPVEISQACRAGTGCGSCVPELCRILDDWLTRTGSPPPGCQLSLVSS